MIELRILDDEHREQIRNILSLEGYRTEVWGTVLRAGRRMDD